MTTENAAIGPSVPILRIQFMRLRRPSLVRRPDCAHNEGPGRHARSSRQRHDHVRFSISSASARATGVRPGALLQPHAQPAGHQGRRLRHGLHPGPLPRRRVGAARTRVPQDQAPRASLAGRGPGVPARLRHARARHRHRARQPREGRSLRLREAGDARHAHASTSTSSVALYSRTQVDLDEPRWVFLNTFFSLSEAGMYAQLVDRLDAGPARARAQLPRPVAPRAPGPRRGARRGPAEGRDRRGPRRIRRSRTPTSRWRCSTRSTRARSCC